MTIAISATFTAEAIEPGLSFWLRQLGLPGEIRFAAYHQVFQQLLDPSGLFSRNSSGANVVLVRFEDWPAAQPEEFLAAVRAAATRLSVPLLVVLCPGAANFDEPVRRGVADLPSVYLLTAAEIASLYPVVEIHDPHGNELGRVPYTSLYFVALATAVARKLRAILAPPFKVIALDCDDTLWSGICGEDGPEGVLFDTPRLALQQFMSRRRQEGMLLTLCSKNNEEDVSATFQAHPEIPLRWEDFVAHRINWEPKGANLAALAEELELDLGSFLFVDDNPKEVQEAEASVPQVLALALPAEPEEIPAFLDHVWAFDRARITTEDLRRGELYAQRAERVRAQRSSGSLQEFLASLQLEVAIAPLGAGEVDRAAQLTQRTNQMNASCIRRTAAELQHLAGQCLAVHVTDRFGSYGFTGLAIYREEADALLADTFLLSCRALGRGVEHRMIARLGSLALERGLEWVAIPFTATQRNRPALLFLQSLASNEGGIFRLSARQAAAVEYKAAEGERIIPPSKEAPKAGARAPIPYAHIAATLRTPEAIQAAIDAASRAASQAAASEAASRRHVPARRIDPPRTALERDLAALWAELLHLDEVGVHENFFELGGHSLLAVQLLSRVRQLYSVELSLEVVYSGEFTVAALAKAVELKELEQAGGDYHELIEELEGLSDEEVRALLAEEQDAG